MIDFVRGHSPQTAEEVPRYLEELGLRIEEAFLEIALAPVTATTTELVDIAALINVSALKVEGFMVFNATTNIPVWAVGDTAGAVWVNATGATAHTPV